MKPAEPNPQSVLYGLSEIDRAYATAVFPDRLSENLRLDRRVCVSCGRRTTQDVRTEASMTRGHLISRGSAPKGAHRFWARQCSGCNTDQGWLSYYEWVERLIAEDDPRVPVAFAALKAMLDLGLGVADVCNPARYKGPTRIATLPSLVRKPGSLTWVGARRDLDPARKLDEVVDVVLICGLLEEPEIGERPSALADVDAYLVAAGGEALAQVDRYFSGNDLPGVLAFAGTATGVDPASLKTLILKQPWIDPEQVCLVMRSARGRVVGLSPDEALEDA